MTKGELLRALEPFSDDVEIIVDLTQEFTGITITRPIESIDWWQHRGEILLKVGQ